MGLPFLFALTMAEKFYYGGQAVIEGVMMRGRQNMAVAVRRPDGEVSLLTEPLNPIYSGRLRQLPLVRGMVMLVETLVLGVKALLYSARVALGEDTEDTKVSSAALWSSLAVGFGVAIALFLVIPLLLIRLVDPYVTAVAANTVEGVIRLLIFLIYLKAITLLPDIRRVFAYHGAEHKAVNAYEAGAELDVETVRSFSTAHPRCGTAFLLIVLVIAVIAFAFLGRPPLWLRFLSRLALLPVIAAVSYEALRFTAAHTKNSLVRLVLAPGLALQSLTTRQPDDQQVEVALRALQTALEADAAS